MAFYDNEWQEKIKNFKILTTVNLLQVAIWFLVAVSFLNAIEGARETARNFFPMLPEFVIAWGFPLMLLTLQGVIVREFFKDVGTHGFWHHKIAIKLVLVVGVFSFLVNLEMAGGGNYRKTTATKEVAEMTEENQIKLANLEKKHALAEEKYTDSKAKKEALEAKIKEIETNVSGLTLSKNKILASDSYKKQSTKYEDVVSYLKSQGIKRKVRRHEVPDYFAFQKQIANLENQIQMYNVNLTSNKTELEKLKKEYTKSETSTMALSDSIMSLTLTNIDIENSALGQAEKAGRSNAGWMVGAIIVLTILHTILKLNKIHFGKSEDEEDEKKVQSAERSEPSSVIEAPTPRKEAVKKGIKPDLTKKNNQDLTTNQTVTKLKEMVTVKPETAPSQAVIPEKKVEKPKSELLEMKMMADLTDLFYRKDPDLQKFVDYKVKDLDGNQVETVIFYLEMLAYVKKVVDEGERKPEPSTRDIAKRHNLPEQTIKNRTGTSGKMKALYKKYKAIELETGIDVLNPENYKNKIEVSLDVWEKLRTFSEKLEAKANTS